MSSHDPRQGDIAFTLTTAQPFNQTFTMNPSNELDYEMTLDPPGRIAVIGGGPLGLEAALYGRYLGYEVTLFEKGEMGQSLRSRFGELLPMLPDRCLTPLAVSALKAHDGGLSLPGDPTYPMTVEEWVNRGLIRMAETDLLLERVLTNHEVTSIATCDVEADDDDDVTIDAASEESESYVDGEVPPDYQLTIRSGSETLSFVCEAVIVAIGLTPNESIPGLSELAVAPYLYQIGHRDCGSDEASLHQGWHQIVKAYAELGGRKGLDLYRPVRS